MRRCTPTWLAARPVPGAAYMVSIMDSTSVATAPSMFSTSRVRSFRTGSPYWRMGRSAIGPVYRRPCRPRPALPSSDRRWVHLDAQSASWGPRYGGEKIAERPVLGRLDEETTLVERRHAD